jgi:hypothetical protein
MTADESVCQGAVDEDADTAAIGVRQDLGFDVASEQVVRGRQGLDGQNGTE